MYRYFWGTVYFIYTPCVCMCVCVCVCIYIYIYSRRVISCFFRCSALRAGNYVARSLTLSSFREPLLKLWRNRSRVLIGATSTVYIMMVFAVYTAPENVSGFLFIQPRGYARKTPLPEQKADIAIILLALLFCKRCNDAFLYNSISGSKRKIWKVQIKWKCVEYVWLIDIGCSLFKIYKYFEAFDWSIRRKNFINWPIKKCFKAFVASSGPLLSLIKICEW